jgi:hypothetical protein
MRRALVEKKEGIKEEGEKGKRKERKGKENIMLTTVLPSF